MRTTIRHAVRARAAFLAIALLFLLPAAATAHAEFDTSSPADGDTVQGTPDVISADFTDTLGGDSTFELLDGDGTRVAEGEIDPTNDQRMVIDPPELEPGSYEVRWQAIAEDGHLERGTYEFTVIAAPTQPPTPSAPPSAEPSATATTAPPTAEPSAIASPTPDSTETASTTDVLLPIMAAVVILAVLAGYLLNRRRAAPPA